MYSSSQHFQLVYFCRFATFSKDRHAVMYSVGSLDVSQTYKACRSLRSWASKNGSENMQFLYKYDKISLFGQICQHEASCTPGLVEQRTCITNGEARGLRGAQPPAFEKHGQRSEHTSFLTVHSLFCFASCLHYEIRGGGGRQPPPSAKHGRGSEHIYLLAPL